MSSAHVIIRETLITRTARVMQVEGMFDVPPSERSGGRWEIALDLPDAWNVGVIVGPSGAGKTTIARELFGDHLVSGWEWPTNKSILDGFPASMSIKDIVALLSSVGFSSPPSWVRPSHVFPVSAGPASSHAGAVIVCASNAAPRKIGAIGAVVVGEGETGTKDAAICARIVATSGPLFGW